MWKRPGPSGRSGLRSFVYVKTYINKYPRLTYMDTSNIPRICTKAYLASLTEEEKEVVEEYRKERRREAALKASAEYRKRNSTITLTEEEIPKRITTKYLESLTKANREFVEQYKREKRLRLHRFSNKRYRENKSASEEEN